MFPGSDAASNNWIYDFSSFDDIIVALKHAFHITESLDTRRTKSLFLRELKQNKTRFEILAEGVNIEDYPDPRDLPMENLFQIVADKFGRYVVNEKGSIKGLGQELRFPGDEIGWLLWYTSLLPATQNLRNLQTSILKRVIEEGMYLSFDSAKGTFNADYFITVLEKLLDMIDTYSKFHDSPIYSQSSKDISQISTDGSGHLDTIYLPVSIAVVIIVQAKAARIYDLISCILNYIENGNSKDLLEFDFSADHLKKYHKST